MINGLNLFTGAYFDLISFSIDELTSLYEETSSLRYVLPFLVRKKYFLGGPCLDSIHSLSTYPLFFNLLNKG